MNDKEQSDNDAAAVSKSRRPKRKRRKRTPNRRKLPPDAKVLRRDVAIVGVNAVLRGIEKGTVCAVLTSGNTRQQQQLVVHVTKLCAERNVPHCHLGKLHRVLTQLFGIKRVSAVGILTAAAERDIDVDEIGRIVANSGRMMAMMT